MAYQTRQLKSALNVTDCCKLMITELYNRIKQISCLRDIHNMRMVECMCVRKLCACVSMRMRGGILLCVRVRWICGSAL